MSRDLGWLKHGRLEFGYWPRSTDPEVQVEEVLNYFELSETVDPFTRCMKCNGLLESATLAEVAESVPPKVKAWCSDTGSAGAASRYTGKDPTLRSWWQR